MSSTARCSKELFLAGKIGSVDLLGRVLAEAVASGKALILKGNEGMAKYFFIAGTLFLTAFGQLVLRARAVAVAHGAGGRAGYLVAMFLDAWVWLSLCGAMLAAICWILTLRQLSVSAAYPFMALSFVIVPAGALLFLGERVTTVQWAGCCLIVVGVAVTAFGTSI